MYTPSQAILDDSYRIERELGRGAFGVVYLATHRRLNVPRAIKVLHADAPGVGSTLIGDYRARFQKEAQLAARLTHPHVIQVHDFVEWQGNLHCIMEYAPGGSLAGLLRAEGPLSAARVIALLDDACLGLEAIHTTLDAVHCDLSPANLLLDASGRVKVADLGLAQLDEDPSPGSIFGSLARPHPGTAGYRSPEHDDGARLLTPAADVYGLGSIVFELLTGKRWEKVSAKVTGPRGLRADVPEWLDAVVARMLAEQPPRRQADAQDPAKRYDDAAAVRTALAAKGLGDSLRPAAARDTRPQPRRPEQELAAPRTAAERAAAEQAAAQPLLEAIFERTGIKLVYIPAGVSLYGVNEQRVTLPSSWIGLTPVTNAQYARFVTSTDRNPPVHWTLGRIPAGKEHHPVTYVSWEDANAFCEWAGLQLPGEQEWEKAARGTDGRTYPWGEREPYRDLCNFNNIVGTTTPVGQYPKGASAYGLLDMAGNVCEWCADWYQVDKYRVLRGGAFDDRADLVCCVYRNWYVPDGRFYRVGFRAGAPLL